MRTPYNILLGFVFGLIVGNLAYLAQHVWFWIAIVEILNVIAGIIGAALIYNRFFQRRLTLEILGIWTFIIFAGFLVFIGGIFYKPRYPVY